MKHISHIFPLRSLAMRILFSFALIAIWVACSDDSAELRSTQKTAKSNKFQNATLNNNKGSSKSESSAGDYNISLSVNGLTWTYVITKNSGAKDLSHFILNFQNCGAKSATIQNIVWATVNGLPAKLENSEGKTGCAVSEVTNNFVKFDNLPDAASYTIVFKTDRVFGHFVGTTAWLKAGTSCFAYPVLAPCCPM